MSADFFNNIPKISKFIGVIDDSNFHPAPEDWTIVVADIISSTQAVAEGRYKDVNMIGASVICAVQNATGIKGWPFVFGGDGATLLVDSAYREVIEAALVRTRSLAADEFDLELRIGFVSVEEVRSQGLDVLVARYEASPGNSFALFGGGGVEHADRLVKLDKEAERYAIQPYTLEGMPDLTGLSCRWEALPAKKGSILCLMVSPLASSFHEEQLILASFLSRLAEVVGFELSQASPVNKQSLKFSWPPQGLSAEAKATRAGKPYWLKFSEIFVKSFIQWVLERFTLSGWGYDASVYSDDMITNSDYCKFDDVLRMVLDCTPEQVKDIRNILDDMHQKGQADYGLYETDQALMTCLLFDLDARQHVHFIDGNNGGLYSASLGYKQQHNSLPI